MKLHQSGISSVISNTAVSATSPLFVANYSGTRAVAAIDQRGAKTGAASAVNSNLSTMVTKWFNSLVLKTTENSLSMLSV